MARFITRVELHDADYDDYETLHTAMEAEGFERTITSDDEITYHLPTAEYYREADLTRQEVLTAAKRAAAKTLRKVWGYRRGIEWNYLERFGRGQQLKQLSEGERH